jgi:fermentation-respiration switch protein FrsA (DUF1100 family)
VSAFLGGVVAIYVALLIILFIAQRSILYVPNTQAPSLAEAGVQGLMEAVETRSADGLRLLAWYHAPPTDSSPVLVYFHGNAGHIGHRADRARPYIDAGFGVLLVEYRGYGGNPGRPTEDGLYADARAAVDFLTQQDVAPDRMVLYGESLGTAVAVQIARERDCAALVLEAPFTSVAAVAQSRYWMFPVRHLVVDKFDSLAKIGTLRCPLFVMHGEADGVVPIRFGRQLYEAAKEPKESKWFAAGTHVNFDELGGPAAVLGFLRRHGLAPQENR